MISSADAASALDLFEGIPTSAVSDCLGRLAGTHTLRPQHGESWLRGTALTVRVRAGDNLAIHDALRQVRPGHVLAVSYTHLTLPTILRV